MNKSMWLGLMVLFTVATWCSCKKEPSGPDQGRCQKQLLLPETEFRIGSDPGCREL